MPSFVPINQMATRHNAPKAPEERGTEGTRLAFERGGGEFNQEVSGCPLFVLTRLGANPTQKKPPGPSGVRCGTKQKPTAPLERARAPLAGWRGYP
jgi:hypothetical protein